MSFLRSCLFVVAILSGVEVWAGSVEIVDVNVSQQSAHKYRFSVTLKHADTGWDHYADQWQVVSADGGQVYGTRTLHHPHVNEQPFTRSLSGVSIPDHVRTVQIRARDSVHGVGEKGYPVKLKP